MYLDFWHGETIEDVDDITVFFSDVDCTYRGNMSSKGKIIGDFSTKDSSELYKTFPQIFENDMELDL